MDQVRPGYVMRIKFLCPQHREALLRNPEAARQLWLENYARLTEVPPEPSPHRVNVAGSALEAANIYLEARPGCDPGLIRLYTSSALALIAMLVELGQTRLGIVVVAVSNAMVEEVARHRADATEALAACERLTADGMAIVAGNSALA